jgi:hypothetical protein
MHQGSCLCGAVRYEIDGEPGPIMFCHCRPCRKANGSAFNAAVPVRKDQLRIVSGEEAMKEYESSPGVYRVFCGGCGAPLFSKRDSMPDLLRFRLGTLDTPVAGKPTAHIFVAEKAEWYDICDDLPQHAERP